MDKLTRFADVPVVCGPSWSGIGYFCSTRMGGVSQGPWASLNLGLHTGDDPLHVAENRRRLFPAESVYWVKQVHGTEVHDVDVNAGPDDGLDLHSDSAVDRDIGDAERQGGHDQIQADAMVTSHPGRVLAIMTADCLPVILGSTDGKALGIAHAGWRGLAAGVLENTLAVLHGKHGGRLAPQWRAWIGPAIGQSCFEVGDEVRHQFISTDTDTSLYFEPTSIEGKWLADLKGIAKHRLHKAGVKQVDVADHCTYSNPDLFYSYRRDGTTGRLATFAWLQPDGVINP